MFVDAWEVVQPLTHLGRAYVKGEAIELDANTAFQLVAAGMVKKPEPKPVSTDRGQPPKVDVGRAVPPHKSGPASFTGSKPGEG